MAYLLRLGRQWIDRLMSRDELTVLRFPPPEPTISVDVDPIKVFEREFDPIYGRFPKPDLRLVVHEVVGPRLIAGDTLGGFLKGLESNRLTLEEWRDVLEHYLAACSNATAKDQN